MGDPAGIGAEIIVKALSHVEVYQKCIPIVIGDYEPLKDAIKFCHLPIELREIHDVTEGQGEFGRIDVINMGYLERNSWEYKKIVHYVETLLFNMLYMELRWLWKRKCRL